MSFILINYQQLIFDKSAINYFLSFREFMVQYVKDNAICYKPFHRLYICKLTSQVLPAKSNQPRNIPVFCHQIAHCLNEITLPLWVHL